MLKNYSFRKGNIMIYEERKDDLKVEKWFVPVDDVKSDIELVSQMTRDDHALLCGLINSYRPSTILEIGVAEGGTTVVMAQALKELNISDGKIISVDYCEKFYMDSRKETGYIFNQNRGRYSSVNHCYYLGHTIANCIEEIADENDIDMVVIDTTHMLPGELLDFICIIPYINDGTLIVLHDVNCDRIRASFSDSPDILIARDSNATRLLLSVVSGKKYFPSCKFDNIGAFVVDSSTRDNIVDVFYLIESIWRYNLDDIAATEYSVIVQKNYSSTLYNYFTESIKDNCDYVNNLEIYNTNHRNK